MSDLTFLTSAPKTPSRSSSASSTSRISSAASETSTLETSSVSSSPSSASSLRNAMPSCILITGTTGFLGKVVLEEVIRRREELEVDKVYVLVRQKRDRDALSRFDREVAASPCFADLPKNWTKLVEVIEGDVTKERCAISGEKKYLAVCQELTHIINCAADVSFETPIKEAVEANITTSVSIHQMAQDCPNLQRLTITSTAYVSHTPGPIHEELSPLPKSATEIMAMIEEDKCSEQEILKFTGHPNTYTLTKCLSEHVIFERPSRVPVTMVRPSIICVSRQYPCPGWIDSWAAMAGIAGAVGTGLLKALIADPKAYLDVVPVDDVARVLIDETYRDEEEAIVEVSPPRIAYAVASMDHALEIGPTAHHMLNVFKNDLKGSRANTAALMYIGPRNFTYTVLDYLYQRLPMFLARMFYSLVCDDTKKRNMERATKNKNSLEIVLEQFATKTWDFRPQTDLLPGFCPRSYATLVCLGVNQHLLSKLKL